MTAQEINSLACSFSKWEFQILQKIYEFEPIVLMGIHHEEIVTLEHKGFKVVQRCESVFGTTYDITLEFS